MKKTFLQKNIDLYWIDAIKREFMENHQSEFYKWYRTSEKVCKELFLIKNY